MRRTKRTVGAALAAAAILLLAGCSETEDLATFNTAMFSTPISTFTTEWKAKHAEVRSVSVSTVNNWWNQGNGSLDSQAAKDYWFDMSTDFCSSSPDTGLYFDFKAACTRHDFGWRNLKKLDRHWNCAGSAANKPCGTNGLPVGQLGGYWKLSNRLIVNNQFKADMYSHCATRSILYRPACYDTADLYYNVVNVAALNG